MTREPAHILVVIGHYLPGYKAGGPIRSVANLVELLGDEFRFSVLTADRDFGDAVPYPTLKTNVWQHLGKARIMHLSPNQMSLRSWGRHVRATEHDLLYLNSFFAPQTRKTLFLRRFNQIPHRPIVLAPRGEFSLGALGLKPMKKKMYMQAALRTGLYDDIVWHATSDSEISDMQTVLAHFFPDFDQRVKLAPNLAAPVSTSSAAGPARDKQSGSVRIIFLSRVARMKNLAFALATLQGIEQPIVFDLYGPKEDLAYWEECQQIIQTLPSNIRVTYCGAVAPDQVPRMLSHYHLFFLPTLGENFGHAIVEAWAAGCPVLISDQTPWRELEQKGIGWDIPLFEPTRFQDALRQVIAMDQLEFSSWSNRSRQFADNLVRRQSHSDLQAYRDLFLMAMRG